MLNQVNEAVLKNIEFDASRPVSIPLAGDVEVDEMWSFVQNKSNQHWLWHAVDHYTGQTLAYVFGTRKDDVFKELKAMLKPFGIRRFYTDNWGAYEHELDPKTHTVSKRYTQKIEQKHLTLRTRIKRLARKTICFSKDKDMHETLIGIFINRYEFGRSI